MVEEVVWLKRAKTNFNSVISYLKSEWSLKAAEEFYLKTDQVIKLLSEFPKAGNLSKKKQSARKFLITKHNYVLYKLEKKKLYIVNIVDTRKGS